MKLKRYNQIIAVLERGCSNTDAKTMAERITDVPLQTLGSIYAQAMQRKVRRTHHRVSTPESMAVLYRRYQKALKAGEGPGILLQLAKDIDFSAAMLAKLLLEYHIKITIPEGQTLSKSQMNKYLRDTSLIEDRDLSLEVYLCHLQDEVYGPFADSIKHSVGQEYEFHLKQELNKCDIRFHDEDELRSKGYDKTPDIKLELPIAVDGHVVNWIESKASFGDEDSHKVYLRDQFWSYWNRFGPGLVIYWFGFIDELNEHEDKGILLRDCFPCNITKMDPLLLITASSSSPTTNNFSHSSSSPVNPSSISSPLLDAADVHVQNYTKS